MGEQEKDLKDLREGVLPASNGAGPFLQRDYWGVLRSCRLKPSEVAALVRERFADFPPAALVVFRRPDGGEGPLQVGDELEVDIRMAGKAMVRVTHVDDQSLTLATIEGHPEAGRITFGAYRNEHGDVLFHIRSRARSCSPVSYVGFFTAGEAMQTNTWTDFIDCLAHSVADGVVGAIFAETQELEDDREADVVEAPTFIATGD